MPNQETLFKGQRPDFFESGRLGWHNTTYNDKYSSTLSHRVTVAGHKPCLALTHWRIYDQPPYGSTELDDRDKKRNKYLEDLDFLLPWHVYRGDDYVSSFWTMSEARTFVVDRYFEEIDNA